MELFGLEQNECLHLLKPFDVRWASYHPAIERLLN